MFPNTDTFYAALKAERGLALKRAERRALLLEAVEPHRATAAGTSAGLALARLSRMARAIRFVRAVLRPVQA